MAEALLPPQSKSGLYVPHFIPEGHLYQMRPHEYVPGDIIYTNREIQERLWEISAPIAEKYKYHELLAVPVLKGAMWVATDLVSILHERGLDDMQVSPIGLGSYGPDTESSGVLKLNFDTDINPQGRHVLLVEDIVDTGNSLEFLYNHFGSKGVENLCTFALLSKPSRRQVDYEADYYGFEIPNYWMQGYGLDTDQIGRGNPNLIVGPVFGKKNPERGLVLKK